MVLLPSPASAQKKSKAAASAALKGLAPEELTHLPNSHPFVYSVVNQFSNFHPPRGAFGAFVLPLAAALASIRP
jgi:hypothetical protein